MTNLEEKIANVFAPVPRPAAGKLLHPDSRDPAAIVPFEPWESWQEVPKEILCRHWDALSFFGPEAFRFFPPAFMVATLRLYRTSTEYVSDATVFELQPHSDYARSRYALFTRKECEVVVEFLERMAASPEHADAEAAKYALREFWSSAARGRGRGA